MAHSLSPAPTPAIPISAKSDAIAPFSSSLGFQRFRACQSKSKDVSNHNKPIVPRRIISLALTAALVGLNLGGDANAARRPPPPPPEEKKDPNVSGVQAKVLASKKRKEAMKAFMAKLREKGKPVLNDAVKQDQSAD
ncbi:uncharacterized protein LOC110825845 [Carica papaya]|uniref:uncharacterized protein LOC110825845 n=1 Tax=Carica papaya TaxID=3649 RepID=UPI000B8D12C5|nr:uncharacterized protein LOC110825845 [Carica papaya]